MNVFGTTKQVVSSVCYDVCKEQFPFCLKTNLARVVVNLDIN